MWHKRILMCRPDHYKIDYEINDWMSIKNQSNKELALEQWTRLHHMIIRCGGYVEYIEQEVGCPDMVFTANAGIVRNNKFLVSTFKHAERKVEEHYWTDWFLENDYEVSKINKKLSSNFEGAGDCLEWGDHLVCGWGQRSNHDAGQVAGEKLGYPKSNIKSYKLSSGYFYHLDTCFCPLNEEVAVIYPQAFELEDWTRMQENFSNNKFILVNEEEAKKFACNAVVIGEHVIMPAGCEETATAIAKHGFKTHLTDMSEFIKSGGACKCLTLELPD